MKEESNEEAESKRKEEHPKKSYLKTRKKTRGMGRLLSGLHHRRRSNEGRCTTNWKGWETWQGTSDVFRSKLGLIAKCTNFSELNMVAYQVQICLLQDMFACLQLQILQQIRLGAVLATSVLWSHTTKGRWLLEIVSYGQGASWYDIETYHIGVSQDIALEFIALARLELALDNC